MIDFHCHIDLYPDPAQVARECISRGLAVLSVTTTPSAWVGTEALALGSPNIRTALGLHPQLAHERKGELLLFDRLLHNTPYVGEIGLDGGPEFKSHWGDQLMVFGHILDSCSRAGGRVLSIHSRRAATPVLDALEARPGVGVPILHWFSGTIRELDRAVELGCWFSVGPSMLAGQKGRALAARMPRARVLTESDGPFARVGDHVAMPWDVKHSVSALSGLWEESMVDVCSQIASNLDSLRGDSLPAS